MAKLKLILMVLFISGLLIGCSPQKTPSSKEKSPTISQKSNNISTSTDILHSSVTTSEEKATDHTITSSPSSATVSAFQRLKTSSVPKMNDKEIIKCLEEHCDIDLPATASLLSGKKLSFAVDQDDRGAVATAVVDEIQMELADTDVKKFVEHLQKKGWKKQTLGTSHATDGFISSIGYGKRIGNQSKYYILGKREPYLTFGGIGVYCRLNTTIVLVPDAEHDRWLMMLDGVLPNKNLYEGSVPLVDITGNRLPSGTDSIVQDKSQKLSEWSITDVIDLAEKHFDLALPDETTCQLGLISQIYTDKNEGAYRVMNITWLVDQDTFKALQNQIDRYCIWAKRNVESIQTIHYTKENVNGWINCIKESNSAEYRIQLSVHL